MTGWRVNKSAVKGGGRAHHGSVFEQTPATIAERDGERAGPPRRVPVPYRLRGRPTRGGLPVPYLVALLDEDGHPSAAGRPDFRIADPVRAARCMQQRRCGLCAHTLERTMVFLGGPGLRESRSCHDTLQVDINTGAVLVTPPGMARELEVLMHPQSTPAAPGLASGIYRIVHTASGRSYIGSAVHIGLRWNHHRASLRAHKHHNRLLQRAWNKYGEPAFTFEVIERVPAAQLIEREQSYLDALWVGPKRARYNVCGTAGSTLGRCVSPATRQKLRQAGLGKPLPPDHHWRNRGGPAVSVGADQRSHIRHLRQVGQLSYKDIAVATGVSQDLVRLVCLDIVLTASARRQIAGRKERRISQDDEPEIARLSAAGLTTQEIAAHFGVSAMTIRRHWGKPDLSSRPMANNRLGVRGVTYDSRKGTYRAQIYYDGRIHALGSFSSLDEAAAAYIRAAYARQAKRTSMVGAADG